MVGLLVALALSSPGPLDRYFHLMDRSKSFQARFEARIDGRPERATGTFALKHPNRLKFVAYSGNSKYVYVAGPNRTVEYEASLQRYAEFATGPVVTPPESRVSGTADFWFPTILVLREQKQLRVPVGSLKVQGKSVVRGIDVEVVRAIHQGMAFEFQIDAQGRLICCVWPQNTGDGLLMVRFDFFDIVLNAQLQDKFFDISAPAGFNAVAAPRELHPLNAGDEFPDVWVDRLSKKVEAPWGSAGRTLIIAASPDDSALSKAQASIQQLKASVAVITMDSQGSPIPALKSYRHFYDPSGRAYERLGVPGTPAFYVVDSSGRIVKFHLGFDPRRAADFVAEFRKALGATR